MAVFYWVGGYTGSTAPESGYNATGNYWTNWITGLTSTIGDLFYSPYAWNVRENWRLEHTGQVQPSGTQLRVFRDSVPTRLPGGGDSVILGGWPGYLGTGPYAGGGSTAYYISNIAPHNFSILFGGMSGDGITSAGLTTWNSGGTANFNTQPCDLTVIENFTQLNKTWGDVAPSWASTNGLTGLQIRTGEMGTWGLKYLWGDSRQGLSGDALGRALALASSPLRLRIGNGIESATCWVNRKESNRSVTGGAVIHIDSVGLGQVQPAGPQTANAVIWMRNRNGWANPFTQASPWDPVPVYGTSDIVASNHYLILKGTWKSVNQGCGNTHLEDSVEIADEFQLGKNVYEDRGAVGHLVSTRTANVNRFELKPSHVYGSGGNQGINIECNEQIPVNEIYAYSWTNQSPTNCLTIGHFSPNISTVNFLEISGYGEHGGTAPGQVLRPNENPRSAAGLSASEFWRIDYPWSVVNWWQGPIVHVRNVMFNDIYGVNGAILPDPDSGLNHYVIFRSGYVSHPVSIVGRKFGDSSWKNFLIGFSPGDPGLVVMNDNGAYTTQPPYANPNIIIPYDGMGIKLLGPTG